MKRRLAYLLALSLTFASFSVTGAAAAEAEPANTQVVTEVQEEAAQEEAASTEETAEPAEEEEVTTETADEQKEDAEAVEENAEETEGEETEEAQEGATDESAEEGMTDETAAVEEPADGATEEAAVVEETLIEEEAKKAEEAKNGWVSEGGKWFYYTNGKKEAGGRFISVGGAKYYLNADGSRAKGWKTVDGKVRYFMDTSYSKYEAAKEGQMLTGWKIINNKVFYLDKSTGEQYQGWKTIDGYKYYFNDGGHSGTAIGERLTGFKNVYGVSYYFADYRCKSLPTGARATGWKVIGGNTYYFKDSKYTGNAAYGQMLTGAKYIGGKAYYFNKSGVMQTGWVKTTAGVMAYYTSSGASTGKAGWKQNGSAWYYLNANGMAKTGWLTLNSKSIYYLDKDKAGKMTVGPKKFPNGKIYFFDNDGRRAVTAGWRYYDGYYYYANASGTTAANMTVGGVKLDSWGRTTMSEMDRKAQDYSSNTNYLILVDKDAHKVCVYKGKKNNWVRIKGPWTCTHGGSDTPSGVHETWGPWISSDGYGWDDFRMTSAAFCTSLSSGNYFHTILFDKYTRGNPYNLTPVDDTLGASYSHGCIRLKIEYAEWIYRNIPAHTKVVVYN